MDASFFNKAEGIPGDDDSGAMSAWYVFAAMGLYPEIPGVGGFAVTGPLFPNIKLNLDGGRQIIIRAKNAGQDAPYIKSMSLNKTRCQQTWLTHEQLTDYRPPSFEPKE
jgi:putative alpha-1,2-mannosidase